MAKGRKAKPTALKKLSGTAQPCRVNKNEMTTTVITRIPPVPRWFTPLAKKVYRDTTQQLKASGVLQSVDLQMLIAYCHEYANYLDIQKKLDRGEEPQVIEVETKNGVSRQINPLVKIAQASLDRAKAIAVEYGFTPASRSKVDAGGKGDGDEFEDYLGRK